MKKIITGLLIVLFLLFSGCGKKNEATAATKSYLDKYRNHDAVVLDQIDYYVNSEDDMTSSQKNIYKEILKRQYKDLTYEIIEEEYDGDDATVTVKITVYDLYKAQKDALEYMEINSHEFYDENSEYDNSKFLNYKLNIMQSTDLMVTYTVDLYLTKDDNGWKVTQPSNMVLQKIHGIYNYDNR